MIGQGSPSSSPTARAREAPLLMRTFVHSCCAVIARVTLTVCTLSASSVVAQEAPVGPPVRLRISWGGDEAIAWRGRAWIDDGAVSDMRLLGLAADSAGSIWLDNGRVRIESLSPRKLDAIEVAANASETAQLFVELVPVTAGASQHPLPVKVPIAEVLRRPVAVQLDDRGSKLQVDFVPPEALEIVTDRKILIFAPGEEFSFELRPHLSDMAPGTSLEILAALAPGRRDQPTWRAPQRLEIPVDGAPATTINVPLPTAEGVYTISVAATRSPGFRPRFFPGGAASTAERSIDVVVLDSKPRPASGNESWQTVLEIDPTSPSWWERLPSWTQLRRLPAMNFRPIGSTRSKAIDLPYGRFVELPPTSPGKDPHWQAYSLPVEAVGVPHVLEIEYPVGDEQHFSLSIIEPNAAGFVEGIGRDSGVYVEGFGRESDRETHRMVFWPRTQSPMLLVTNEHPSAAAMFGHIRVLKHSSPHLSASPDDRVPGDRLVAAYIARPLLAESFGATNGVGGSTALSPATTSIDDWQTMYESATRLAEFVRHGGYNSAVVSVLADGSAIYPSSLLAATPLYVSGHAAADTPDRDGLELLLRVFDREGLALVPALQLAAPLPELEALRRVSNPQTSGLEWIGPNGRTWVEVNGTQQGLAPYYNVLDPRVQQAIVNVVGELIERYGLHPSFAGLSMQLSANGYAQLPPLDWGLDDATIARFERDKGIHLAATGPTRFAARHALLTRDHADAWRAWRVEQVTRFYARIASVLRENGGHADNRLILTLEDSFSHPNLASRVRPALLGLPNRVDAALLDAGIDRSQLQSEPGVVLCPTRYVESMTPLAERAIDLELNEAFSTWTQPAQPNAASAALLYNRPQRRQLDTFQPRNNWKLNAPFEIVSQPTPHGAAVRQPYIRALLQHDPAVLLDGGELLPLGHDDTLREARAIVRQLPTSADVSDVVRQPVTVRTYAEPQGITLLVMNASPWHATANVALDVPENATMRPLGHTAAAANEIRMLAAGQQPWPLKLEPYSIRAVRIESPGTRVVDVVAKPSPAAQAELNARLTDFINRDLTAQRTYDVLLNPSFEPQGGAAAIAGWRTTNASATIELDATNPWDGDTCVHFRNNAGAAALESDPFPMPPTGQLAMTVFVRGLNLANGSELRMVIEATDPGHRYRRSMPIVPAIMGAAADQTTTNSWLRQPILVNDLPLELRGDVRLRFEMSGPGDVWLDAINLHDLLFALEWYKFGDKERLQFIQLKHAAKSSFDEGRVVDCTQVLEKYWPRFVAEYTPAVQLAARPPANPQKPLSTQPNQAQQPAPRFGEQFKRLLPGFK